MKIKLLSFLAFAVIFCSCNKDFLDKVPLDSINDANFWTTEQDLQLYVNNIYPKYIVGFGYGFGDAVLQKPRGTPPTDR